MNELFIKLKEIGIAKYILVGIINSIFGYFIGIIFFYLFYDSLGVILVGIFSNTLAILFSFLNYKLIIFKTPFQYFFYEFRDSVLLYLFIFIFNVSLLYFLIEVVLINIYISQFIVITFSILISFVGQFTFVFKNKR